MEAKYQIEMIEALCRDLKSSFAEEITTEQKKVKNYHRLITEELPKLLHNDFGIPLNQIPSQGYLEAICGICETTGN